jgi:hypothetical protein
MGTGAVAEDQGPAPDREPPRFQRRKLGVLVGPAVVLAVWVIGLLRGAGPTSWILIGIVLGIGADWAVGRVLGPSSSLLWRLTIVHDDQDEDDDQT